MQALNAGLSSPVKASLLYTIACLGLHMEHPRARLLMLIMLVSTMDSDDPHIRSTTAELLHSKFDFHPSILIISLQRQDLKCGFGVRMNPKYACLPFLVEQLMSGISVIVAQEGEAVHAALVHILSALAAIAPIDLHLIRWCSVLIMQAWPRRKAQMCIRCCCPRPHCWSLWDGMS